MDGLLGWALLGLAAGATAKAIMPGDKKEPRGCLMTMLLGIAGSVLVGFLLKSVLRWPTSGMMIGTYIGATLGAMLIIFLARSFSK